MAKTTNDAIEKAGRTPPARRNADELDWMPTRREAVPLTPATARAMLGAVVDRVATGKRAKGREAHQVGTALNTLYMRHGDAALGMGSFKALVERHWPDLDDDAWAQMMIARYLTADEAEEHGYWKSFYAVRLMRKLGLETFAALVHRSFDPDGTGERRFADLSANEVKRLATQTSLPARREERVSQKVHRLQKRARELCEQHEAFAGLEVKVSERAGAPWVVIGSAGPEGGDAASKFHRLLWK
jgi:hypothetical protein